MSVLENITGHYRSKIGGEMEKITVPEWKTDVYYKKSSSLKEQSKIIELAQKGATVEALVETLIARARLPDGSKMFRPTDKTVLMNEADPDVVIRVVGEMNNTDLDSVADYEKN